MCAEYVKIGDPPPTKGGDYELEVMKTLRDKLSSAFLLIGNPCFSTQHSFLYEYDLIVFSPVICDVIEVKFLPQSIKVFEDGLECQDGYSLPNVFSILENKTKVLVGRLKEGPFLLKSVPRITSRIVFGPENTNVQFFFKPHDKNNKFVKLSDLIVYYKKLEKSSRRLLFDEPEWMQIKRTWKEIAQKKHVNLRSRHKLGKFVIKRRLASGEGAREYLATDEAPCNVDVHLKEYPFDQLSNIKEVESHLKKATRAMQIVRILRHPYIRCVIGHFRTGCSLVQVSDWFDGQPLESQWSMLVKVPLVNKLWLMSRIAEGFSFCHSKGIFHRNITASNIMVNEALDDPRICEFEFAKDVDLTQTLSKGKMKGRDNRILPPEEFLEKGARNMNYRLCDIYQIGILFYRIIESGAWPFENPLDYCTGQCTVNELKSHQREEGFEETVDLILKMMEIRPENRPDPMQEVVSILNDIIRKSS